MNAQSSSKGSARRIIRTVIKVAVVAAIVAGVVYYLKFAPVPARAHAVKRGPISAEVLGTGTLESRVQATVSSKIGGRLVALHADQNDTVRKGQLLAELDDAELRQQVQIAEASLAAVRAGVERADAEIARAKATVQQTKLENDRNAELRPRGGVSQHELDKSVETHKVAQADLDRAMAAKIESQRQIVTAERTLDYQKQLLGEARILAPFDGLILQRDRENGDVVVPGTAILQIISTGTLWISAWVDESAMAELVVGQPARIVFRSEPDAGYEGKVARLSPQADRETREFLVDVSVERLPRIWAVGQRAEVFIRTASLEDTLQIPPDTIAWRGGVPGVYAKINGKAQWRPVKLGIRGQSDVQVVEGLSTEDVVLSPAGTPLTDGRSVRTP